MSKNIFNVPTSGGVDTAQVNSLIATALVPYSDTTATTALIEDDNMEELINGPTATFYSVPSALARVLSANAATAAVNGRANYSPFFVPAPVNLSRVAVLITTLQASSTVRIGIATWNRTPSQFPLELVADLGTIDSSTTGSKEIAIDVDLDRGWYCTVVVAGGGASSPAMNGTWMYMLSQGWVNNQTTQFSNYSWYMLDGQDAWRTDGFPASFPSTITAIGADNTGLMHIAMYQMTYDI
jgi:hypothetical protein